MSIEPNEANDQSNSEEKPKNESSDEEKSEEFLNFEEGLNRILGLTKEQVEAVKRKTPYRKDDQKDK